MGVKRSSRTMGTGRTPPHPHRAAPETSEPPRVAVRPARREPPYGDDFDSGTPDSRSVSSDAS
jgi:hypothetical protein